VGNPLVRPGNGRVSAARKLCIVVVAIRHSG
jgi:hypothetical protein